VNDLLCQCVELNKALPQNGLVKLTWGNGSVLSDCGNYMAIKPSGMAFETLSDSDISLVRVADGCLVSGKKPSVDQQLHLQMYRAFPQIRSVIHTHSKFATAWAQARIPIPVLGTTHADYFDGCVPVCDALSDGDLSDYETNLGNTIVRYFVRMRLNPLYSHAILIPFHGCLTFSDSPKKALEAAIVLEEVAEMALYTKILGKTETDPESEPLFKKHFERKNGRSKYYGQ
jgi:L-ribulose-5-phosphate 4-epimerase